MGKKVRHLRKAYVHPTAWSVNSDGFELVFENIGSRFVVHVDDFAIQLLLRAARAVAKRRRQRAEMVTKWLDKAGIAEDNEP